MRQQKANERRKIEMDNLPIRIETKRMIFFSTSATNSPALPCPSFIFQARAPITPALPFPYFIVHIQAPITPVLPFAYFVVLALAPFSAVLHIFFLVLKIQAPFFDVLPFLAISLLATASINLHFLFEAAQYRRDLNDFIHRL